MNASCKFLTTWVLKVNNCYHQSVLPVPKMHNRLVIRNVDMHAPWVTWTACRLHPSSTRCAFLSSALSKHERLTLSRHHSQRFVPKAQGQTGGPVRKDKQGAAPDNKGEHRKERNEGTFQDRGSPARRWSDARGDSRGVQRQSMGFRLKGNEGIRDGEDRGKSWRDGPNHSPRNGYSQPDRHDSISAHKGWGRDGVGVGFDARRMERPASHSHDQDAHSMGDTSRQGMRDGRKGGGWHHERGRGRDTSSQDMNRKEGGDWRLGREGDASRSNNSSGDGAVYKASNSGRPTPFKTQAPRADDRPPAHRQQRSTVTGQIPARSSSIKPSLDLPVVREGEGDKGTFFAEGEDARWNRLGLGAEVVAALKALGAHRPSHIQVCAGRSLEEEGRQLAHPIGVDGVPAGVLSATAQCDACMQAHDQGQGPRVWGLGFRVQGFRLVSFILSRLPHKESHA